MQGSKPKTLPTQSINLDQWRQDMRTFVDEMRGELDQIIDEISNTFAPMDGGDSGSKQHNALAGECPSELRRQWEDDQC